MTRLFLIRHAEAEGNIYRRAHGWYDGLISPKGAKQIAALAKRLRDERIDAVYSSDLKRAAGTAGAVTKYHDLTLRTDPRLREQNLGVWEDVPFGNLDYDDPKQMYNFNNDPGNWRVEGAETYAALQRRMRAALTELAAAHDGRTVAVVSHGMAIRAFLADVMGVPSREIGRVPHGDNTAVSLLEYECGAFRVVYANDAGHLTGGLSTFARQSWWRNPSVPDPNNVRFQRLDPKKYPGTYLEFYEKTWRAVHGGLDGFRPALYLDAAARHVAACPDALVTIVRPDGAVAGVTELDAERAKAEGAGWICLCFVEAAQRHRLLGAQLIGHAVSVFRRLGYRSVRLNVYGDNAGAIAFYEAYEFHKIGETDGVSGTLLIMEKEL